VVVNKTPFIAKGKSCCFFCFYVTKSNERKSKGRSFQSTFRILNFL